MYRLGHKIIHRIINGQKKKQTKKNKTTHKDQKRQKRQLNHATANLLSAVSQKVYAVIPM